MPKKLTQEQQLSLINDRNSGLTRKQLAEKYGMSVAGVKSVLARHSVVLPMEQRQSNAYRAKLLKNPDAMQQMRKSLTADVVERRSKAIATRYAQDINLRDLKGQQSRQWWKEHGPDSKYTWSDVSRAIEPLGLSLVYALGDIKLDSAKALVRCHCGLVWQANCFDLLYGKIGSCGCVKSKPQAEIAAWLQESGLEISVNNRQIIGPYELDIVVESHKVAIEYCGLAWHGEMRKESRSYHLDKLERANSAGYRLITVFADEWILHPEAVKGYLSSVLSINTTRVGAREASIESVPWLEAESFLDRWHIQGAGAPLRTVYGLRSNGELIAVASFKNTNETRRGGAREGVWELVRYCVMGGVYVSGGFERLLAQFKRDHSPTTIFTYSDRRWSRGRLYEKAGFGLTSTIPPSYWYFKKNTDFPRFHKSKFRKSAIGALPTETEWEVMQRNGYDRIWDCGLQKWTWTK